MTQQNNSPSSSETRLPSVFPLPSTQRENRCEYHLTSAISHSPDPTDRTSLSPRSITCPGALPEAGSRLSPGEPRHLCSPSSPPASVTSTLAHDGSFSTPELPRTSSFPLKSLAVDGRRALTSQVGAFDVKKGFQLNYYLLKEENPRRGSGTLDGAATP